MYILIVQIRAKLEFVDAFREASLENAQNSIQEPGVVRFDVLQDIEDAAHFTLVEVYRTPEGHAQHRETAHYAKWRDTVTDMMAEPRTATKYHNLFPDDANWG